MIREGQRVSYIGDDTDIEIGSVGRVLVATRNDYHVMWETGPKKNQVDMVIEADLVPDGHRTAANTSVFEGVLVDIPVREVYASSGASGLLRSLANAGHASEMPDIAERIVQHAATLVRSDTSMREVIAQLGDDADDFVIYTVANLLTQAGRECL